MLTLVVADGSKNNHRVSDMCAWLERSDAARDNGQRQRADVLQLSNAAYVNTGWWYTAYDYITRDDVQYNSTTSTVLATALQTSHRPRWQ